jgi:hypothetical protein
MMPDRLDVPRISEREPAVLKTVQAGRQSEAKRWNGAACKRHGM